MGSALGAGWVAGGARVLTSVVGRSDRTRTLAEAAGLDLAATLDEVVAQCDFVASVVPPASAVSCAEKIALAAKRRDVHPLVIDLNAIAPSTVRQIGVRLAEAGCDLLDGSVSGAPPTSDSAPTRVYVCGPRAEELIQLPNPWIDVVQLAGPVGSASALKMCTASMYKGTHALVMQALLTAEANGVREQFLDDTARRWPADVPHWHIDVAVAASKGWRFVDEMNEIAQTQADAGLPAGLFEGVAAAYEWAARTELGHADPEHVDLSASVESVVAGLRVRGS